MKNINDIDTVMEDQNNVIMSNASTLMATDKSDRMEKDKGKKSKGKTPKKDK